MPGVALPILTLDLHAQRYSCHGCGNCCRDFTVQLRDDDIARLREQNWESILGEPVTIEFRGTTFLRQRPDGGCLFLMDDGLCRIHAEHGFEAKPIACQLFPFSLTPTAEGHARMGLNFACQSVLENKGADLRSHRDELQRMSASLPELTAPAGPPRLTEKLRASAKETTSMVRAVNAWLKRSDHSLAIRLDGLAWVVSSLGTATLGEVRDARFKELLDVLFGALPEELELRPIEAPNPRQTRMLRQAIFARVEDPKLSDIRTRGRWRMILRQLKRNRHLMRGRGPAPRIGEDWPEHLQLDRVDEVAGPAEDARDAIDDLLTRYLRATVIGQRCWGAGYYGWSMIRGLQAMMLNVAAVGWLARLHASGHRRDAIALDDVRAALGRIDRTSGRAPWLGSASERLRLVYLQEDDGLRRLIEWGWGWA